MIQENGLALHVKNLSHNFGQRPVLTDLSFSLAASTLCHVKGHNGAGKSTLIRLLAGLSRIQAGSIVWQLPEGSKPFAVKQCYLAPDQSGLYPSLDATANLTFWSNVQGLSLSPEQIKSNLAFWGLAHPLLDLFAVRNFSTGMKRRLAMARLCLAPSALWLLDEPLLGLDQEGCELFARALSLHLKQGGMCLMASHDQHFLDSFSGSKQTLKLGGVNRG